MSKKKNTVDLHLSQDNLDRLLATEKDFQSLKTTRADAYDEIQIAKCDQYATIISHIKPIFSTHKTPSNNLPRQIGIDTRETLMNEVGQSKANAKKLWETSVKFIAKYDADIPSQATPNSVLEVFESMGIKSQNDIKKSVSEDADIDVAEQIAKKLFGKTKKQKVKRDDNITEEQEIYVPSKYNADELQQIWEKLQDYRRERQEHDKASADSIKKTKEDNDIVSRMEDALAS